MLRGKVPAINGNGRNFSFGQPTIFHSPAFPLPLPTKSSAEANKYLESLEI